LLLFIDILFNKKYVGVDLCVYPQSNMQNILSIQG